MKLHSPDLLDWEKDFEDSRIRWRRLFSEGLGTFLLVIVACGAHVVDVFSHGEIGRVAMFTAPGLMVMAIILFMGNVSGAHLNPAVTIGFAARSDFPWGRVPEYIVSQLLGAAFACLVLALLFGQTALFSAMDHPGPGVTGLQALAMEIILTFGLVSTILGTASRAQNVGPLSALAVGGYIALAGLWASPISGASMNPARSFGPDLVLLNFSFYWIYLIGPIMGSLIAVAVAFLLRGPGGDTTARKIAQGEQEKDIGTR